MPYERGETVVISLEVRTSAGVLTDPATSTTIAITDPQGATDVATASMTRNYTGEYSYSWATSVGDAVGDYTATFTTTDGSAVSIARQIITLE